MIEKVISAVEKTTDTVSKLGDNISDFNPDKRKEISKADNLEKRESDKFDPDKRKELSSKSDVKKVDETFGELKKHLNEYIDDVKNASEFPDTLKDWNIDVGELSKVSLERNSELRKEFSNNKANLIREWENKYGQEWPKYKEDIYDAKGNRIREKGNNYDAHHKKPLSLGGENVVENITPLHATVHYDHRGVHARGSAYESISRIMR